MPNTPITLSPSQARKIILHAAGLSKKGQFGRGKEAVYKLIDHLGFIQVDTNYVVERAHHHSIFARVADYKLKWLEELQSEGRIHEFWTFASGFMPMHQFRYSFPVKQAFLARQKALTPTDANAMRKVMDRIGREGPLMARDFENDRVTKSSGWWDWRPSKVALERLHLSGKLITMRRGNFHKVYDLSENVIPPDTDMSVPEKHEYERYVVRRALRMLGITHFKVIPWTDRYVKSDYKKVVANMVASGEVLEVEVEGVKGLFYMLPEYVKKKITLSNDAFILSPFDILNVFRFRLKDFFDFDYQVECFVPEPKRKYGYFSLPVLIGDTFIARMDSKADRKLRVYTINNLHFEKVKLTPSMINKFAEVLAEYTRFNQCISIKLKKTNDKVAAKKIVELAEKML